MASELTKPLEELTSKQKAELLQQALAEGKEDAKAARTFVRLYGFDPTDEGFGGYTRIPNIIFNVFSKFKAKNLETNEIVHIDGVPQWTTVQELEDGKTKDVPDCLAPLELCVFLFMLTIYQRTSLSTISFSKQELSKDLGKSYSTINRTVEKLERLAYIKKLDKRKGVPGGHVRQYDIRPFLEELRRAALDHVLEESQKGPIE
jgi:hypothetical protein